MSVFYDQVEIEDFAYEEETGTYSCPCPCGVPILIAGLVESKTSQRKRFFLMMGHKEAEPSTLL